MIQGIGNFNKTDSGPPKLMDSRANSGNEKITTKASHWLYRLRRKQRVFQPGPGKRCLLRAVFRRTTQCLAFCCPVPRWQNSSLYQILSIRQPHNSQNSHCAQAGTSPPGPHSEFGLCWLQLCVNEIPAEAGVTFPPVLLSECLMPGLMCRGTKLPGEFWFDETLALTLHLWLGTLA